MPYLGAQTVIRLRYEAPAYTSGRASFDAIPGETEVMASVQPLPEKDRQLLPEGARHRDGRKMYCDLGTFRVDDQHSGDQADRVQIGSKIFTVIHVDALHPLISHERVYVVRVAETCEPVSEDEL